MIWWTNPRKYSIVMKWDKQPGIQSTEGLWEKRRKTLSKKGQNKVHCSIMMGSKLILPHPTDINIWVGLICTFVLFFQQITNLEHVTSLTCVCANGTVLPHFLIYAKSWPTLTSDDTLPHGWEIAYSPNGTCMIYTLYFSYISSKCSLHEVIWSRCTTFMWTVFKSIFTGYIDKELFSVWFEKVFLKHCGRSRPVVLLMDNHDSHYSLDLLEKAKKIRWISAIAIGPNNINAYIHNITYMDIIITY